MMSDLLPGDLISLKNIDGSVKHQPFTAFALFGSGMSGPGGGVCGCVCLPLVPGGCLVRGSACGPGGVYLWPGGVCTFGSGGVCLWSRGVSASGPEGEVSASGRGDVSASGPREGLYPNMQWGRHPPVDRQTPVKA